MAPLVYPHPGIERKTPYYATLALSGGGVRGAITLRLCKEIEKLTGVAVTETFDTFSGASIGLFNCCALNCPDAEGRPKFTAAQALTLFEASIGEVFNRTLSQRIRTLNGWWSAKYQPDGLIKMAEQYLGPDMLFKDSIKPIIAPAVNEGPEKAFVFDSRNPRQAPLKMWEVIRAATAAETYFPSFALNIDGKDYTFCDGGTYDNTALNVDYPSLFKEASTSKKVFVVALGTGDIISTINTQNTDRGILGWLEADILGLIFDTAENQTCRNMKSILPDDFKPGGQHCFAYLNPPIPAADSALDDPSPTNLRRLIEKTDTYIEQYQDDIRAMCKVLSDEL